MGPSITLRSTTAEDEPLLYQIYASTRVEELRPIPWNEAEKAAFLTLQFVSRREDHQQRFPNAANQIILADKTPVGRLYVNRQEDEIRIVDIALLSEFRGQGIGSLLIRELLAEAAATSRPVRIHVEKHNPAVRLYQRLGFRKTGETDMHDSMEWLAGDSSTTPNVRSSM